MTTFNSSNVPGIKTVSPPDNMQAREGGKGLSQGHARGVGIVVGHTHWDREWYLPFEGFRARLVAMMDGLVEYLERDPAFRCFVLDGQTILIEDYLEVRPEAEGRVRRLLADDRLKIGPWYTAVDVFLPDPESLVRNLELGRWQAAFYGGAPMPVGHLPDTFGFCAQLPQILRHFGYETGFAWRGFHPEGTEGAFWWDAPDGSRVLMLRPMEGYCEGSMAVVEPERFLAEVLPGILARQDKEPYPDRLFIMGCDHFIASPRLPWVAEQVGARTLQPTFVGSLEEMAARVLAAEVDLSVVRGEQRDPCLAVCPASVCGTRVPLKQANAAVEALLLGLAEPLQALAALTSGEADRAHLRWAWRLLAQNHPHDSIPGCSIDPVHREMMTRFARARMVAVDVSQRGAKRLAASLNPAVRGELGAIGIVGLTGGRGRVRLRLHGMEEGVPPFRIVDTDGSDVPFAMLGQGRAFTQYHRLQDAFAAVAATSYIHLVAPREWVESRRVSPEAYTLPYVDVELEVSAPRAGYRILRIEPASGRAPVTTHARRSKRIQQAQIANEHIRVRAGAEGLWLDDLATGQTWGPVYFSHAGDAGDEYTSYPVPGPAVRFAADATSGHVVLDGLGERLTLRVHTLVPARLGADRKTRVGRVRLEGRLIVSLLGRRADLALELVNRSRDFDLRLVVQVAGATAARCGAPFGVEDRHFEVSHSSPNAPQQALPDFPFRGWTAGMTTEHGGLAVLARGLYEAAVRRLPNGLEVTTTLLRGVGYLSRDDLQTRPGDAGPSIATPDAQCLGPHAWELALLPFGQGEEDDLPLLGEQFLRPPAAFPVQWSAGSAPAEMELFGGDPDIVVSALLPSREDAAAVVHAHNPTKVARIARVTGKRVRLDEMPTVGDATLGPFKVGAWKVEKSE